MLCEDGVLEITPISVIQVDRHYLWDQGFCQLRFGNTEASEYTSVVIAQKLWDLLPLKV